MSLMREFDECDECDEGDSNDVDDSNDVGGAAWLGEIDEMPRGDYGMMSEGLPYLLGGL